MRALNFYLNLFDLLMNGDYSKRVVIHVKNLIGRLAGPLLEFFELFLFFGLCESGKNGFSTLFAYRPFEMRTEKATYSRLLASPERDLVLPADLCRSRSTSATVPPRSSRSVPSVAIRRGKINRASESFEESFETIASQTANRMTTKVGN